MNTFNEQKRNLKRWYDSSAQEYDRLDRVYKVEMEGVGKLLDLKKGDVVLDVGTGTGNYLVLMAQMGAECYGIDISPKMLEIARRKTKDMENVKELKLSDAEDLPYGDDFFDWITCIGMFEYYPLGFAKKVLIEFRRVLKPDGRIVLDFPYMEDPNAQEFKKKEESVGTDVYLYPFERIKSTIADAGFRIVKKHISGFEIQMIVEKKKRD